jgi:hypothetical protein
VSRQFARGAERFLQGFQGWLDQQTARRSWQLRLKELLCRWTRSKGEWRRLEALYTARFALQIPARQWLRALHEESKANEPVVLGSRLNLV